MTDEERATLKSLLDQLADAYQSGISIMGRMAADMSAKIQRGEMPNMTAPDALLTLSVMAEKLVDELLTTPHPPLPGDPP